MCEVRDITDLTLTFQYTYVSFVENQNYEGQPLTGEKQVRKVTVLTILFLVINQQSVLGNR